MQSSSGPRPPAARRAAWFIGLGSVSPPGPQGRVAGRGRATACRSSAIGTVSAGAALAEAVAVAVHLEDIDVMGETVEQCPGQALGAEGLGPFVEREVGGDEGGASWSTTIVRGRTRRCPRTPRSWARWCVLSAGSRERRPDRMARPLGYHCETASLSVANSLYSAIFLTHVLVTRTST